MLWNVTFQVASLGRFSLVLKFCILESTHENVKNVNMKVKVWYSNLSWTPEQKTTQRVTWHKLLETLMNHLLHSLEIDRAYTVFHELIVGFWSLACVLTRKWKLNFPLLWQKKMSPHYHDNTFTKMLIGNKEVIIDCFRCV